MCEANAYIIEDEKTTLIMESVDIAEPVDGGIKLISIFGDQKFINGTIHSLSLVDHKIFIREHKGSRK